MENERNVAVLRRLDRRKVKLGLNVYFAEIETD